MVEVTQADLDMAEALAYLICACATRPQHKADVAAVLAYRDAILRTPPQPDAETAERVARAICVDSGGFDPDERMPNDGPRWRYYEPAARAALAAMNAQGGV